MVSRLFLPLFRMLLPMLWRSSRSEPYRVLVRIVVYRAVTLPCCSTALAYLYLVVQVLVQVRQDAAQSAERRWREPLDGATGGCAVGGRAVRAVGGRLGRLGRPSLSNGSLQRLSPTALSNGSFQRLSHLAESAAGTTGSGMPAASTEPGGGPSDGRFGAEPDRSTTRQMVPTMTSPSPLGWWLRRRTVYRYNQQGWR